MLFAAAPACANDPNESIESNPNLEANFKRETHSSALLFGLTPIIFATKITSAFYGTLVDVVIILLLYHTFIVVIHIRRDIGRRIAAFFGTTCLLSLGCDSIGQ